MLYFITLFCKKMFMMFALAVRSYLGLHGGEHIAFSLSLDNHWIGIKLTMSGKRIFLQRCLCSCGVSFTIDFPRRLI